MKRLLAIAFVLCLTAGCTQKDPESSEVWLRPADLTPAKAPWQPRAIAPDCSEIIGERTEAVQMLTSQPACTNAAVAALERLARIKPDALTDLAVAYAMRAQREDRPTDLLNALDTAQKAVAANTASGRALFNRAMLEEAVGLADDAIDSWKQFLKDDHDAARTSEAKKYLDQMQHRIDPTSDWARNQAALPAALAAHDRQTIQRLIQPYPSSAERYLEEELLRKERIGEATTLATELARLTNDRYVLDVVAALERSPDALQEAHLAFAAARSAERAFGNSQPMYERASQLLEQNGSPLTLLAQLANVVRVSLDKKPDAYASATALLEPIEGEAQSHGYRHLLARIRSTRANFLLNQGRFLESLADSEAALAEYQRDGDAEGASDTRMRRIGVIRTAGHNDLSWREAMQALQTSTHLVETKARHSLFGELGRTAMAFKYPSIALQYQSTAVRLIQRAIKETPPERRDVINGLLTQLSPVLRTRATIEIQLDQMAKATNDLNESIRLGRNTTATSERRILQARAEEVQSQALLTINPARAVENLTAALSLITGEAHTYRASLLAQRADAQRRAGRTADAENDLATVVDELQNEQIYMLQHRKRGAGEQYWSSYFSRFREAYQALIRQKTAEGRADVAFNYAEKERAFEPLYLISEVASKDFDGKTKGLPEIRRTLPAGTQLIEYSVLDNQTIVWLVSRDSFSVIQLETGKSDIDRRSEALQRAVAARNQTDFETQLYSLHATLIAKPLAALPAMPERLVIVPDGPMHGLPFAALRNSTTKRYLIEEAPIEIAGSANLYLVSLQRDRKLSKEPPSALIIGDPAFDSTLSLAQGLRPLAHARSECEKIYPLYAPHAQKLMEREATVPQFLAKAQNSSIIHIAAHSIVNAQAPSRSFILFASSPKESGPLEAQALLTHHPLNHTRLVVLSTCSSAGGLPVGAEGVAPFVRPLIGAGVPAVVGTLWNVEDATAEDLLVSFHRHYREGHDAAVALQLAQVGQLRNNNNKPGLRSVLAWAPFQVIGHGSSPFAPTPPHKEKPP